LFLAVAITAGLGWPCAGSAETQPTLGALVRYNDWLSEHPSSDELAGKVVLVDVFTFGCYNCQNVTPNLRALYREHRGELAIVGIHTPETPYERDRKNVTENLAAQGIVWPVAIDNEQHLWDAYGIEYWPTHMIFDRHGVLRKVVIGDSQDATVNETVKKLLAEK
jgi:thiol-disulfide isomerase/thioredoxin